MAIIYLITAPNGKKYIGQSVTTADKKQKFYAKLERHKKFSTRPVISAIQKYSWAKMKFEVIEESDSWTKADLNERERFWIAYYDTVKTGYNLTPGGDGIDSATATRLNEERRRAPVDLNKKKEISERCSTAQKKRFAQNPDSSTTRQRKRDSHNGRYLIESPDGRSWDTTLGLKGFAEKYADEIGVSYWSLFNAYRRSFNGSTVTRRYKNNNLWKVTRVDESNN